MGETYFDNLQKNMKGFLELSKRSNSLLRNINTSNASDQDRNEILNLVNNLEQSKEDFINMNIDYSLYKFKFFQDKTIFFRLNLKKYIPNMKKLLFKEKSLKEKIINQQTGEVTIETPTIDAILENIEPHIIDYMNFINYTYNYSNRKYIRAIKVLDNFKDIYIYFTKKALDNIFFSEQEISEIMNPIKKYEKIILNELSIDILQKTNFIIFFKRFLEFYIPIKKYKLDNNIVNQVTLYNSSFFIQSDRDIQEIQSKRNGTINDQPPAFFIESQNSEVRDRNKIDIDRRIFNNQILYIQQLINNNEQNLKNENDGYDRDIISIPNEDIYNLNNDNDVKKFNTDIYRSLVESYSTIEKYIDTLLEYNRIVLSYGNINIDVEDNIIRTEMYNNIYRDINEEEQRKFKYLLR